MSFFGVKVGSEVVDLCDFWVKKYDTFWACEDEILSALNSESSETDDGSLHFDELSHGFDSEGTNLSGVKVGIDLVSGISSFH